MRKSTKSSRSKRSRSRKAKRSLAKAPKRLETLRRKSERAAKRRAAEARDDAAEGRTVWVIFDHGSLPGGTDAMPRRGIVSGPDYVRFDNIVKAKRAFRVAFGRGFATTARIYHKRPMAAYYPVDASRRGFVEDEVLRVRQGRVVREAS